MTGSATTTAALRNEIRTALAGAGLTKVDDDVLSQCVGLASSLHLTPKQMAETWESHSLNNGNLRRLDGHSMTSYRLALIRESDASPGAAAAAATEGAVRSATAARNKKKKKRGTDGGDGDGEKDQSLPSVTPPAKRSQVRFDDVGAAPAAAASGGAGGRRLSLSPAAPPSTAGRSGDDDPPGNSNLPKYGERPNAGKVVVAYNPNKLPAVDGGGGDGGDDEEGRGDSVRCTVATDDFDTNVRESYRHYFTTVQERAAALDRHLTEMGERMKERYHLGAASAAEEQQQQQGGGADVAPLEAVGVPRQDKVCCIGRICNAAHVGRINATSVLLEGSRDASGGTRIEVDLSHLKSSRASYSLFPGQIVAVEGLNTSGRSMVAHRICEGAAHEPNKSTVKELLRYHHDDAFQGGRPLTIVAAAGPFTTSDNLEYQPLVDLIHLVHSKKPDVVILAGPFVDMRHKSVRSGQTTLQFQDGDEILVPFETFFANKVAAYIEDLFVSDAAVPTQFVLVPSLEDATAEWVYPQPPLKDSVEGGKASTIPGADGIEVGSLGLHHIEAGPHGKRVHLVSNPCTLKINEVVIGVTATDALFHISADETSANLEPGSRLGRIAQHLLQQRSYYPLFPGSAGTNQDWKKSDQWKMPCAPDLLILPSKLTTFARTILDSSLVVNPGHLTRDTTGGTYAVVDIHPVQRETLEQAASEDVELHHGIPDRARVEVKRI